MFEKRLSFYFLKHYLFSRRANSVVKVISYISLLTIAAAFFVFLLVLSVMNGLRQSSVKRYLQAEPHLEVVVRPKQNRKTIRRLEQVLKDSNVQSYHIFQSQDLILKNSEGLLSGVKAMGLKRENLVNFFSKKEDKELAKNLLSHEILVGADLGYSYEFLEGESLVAFPLESVLYPSGEAPLSERLVIKGFFSLDVPEIDGTSIFYNINDTLLDFRSIKDKTTGLHVKLKEPYQYASLKESVQNLGLAVSSWVERNSELFFALKLELVAMALFLALTGILASFSVSTVLSLLMEQKKDEISLLMAMGLSLDRVKRVFAGISFLLSMLGLTLGLTLSLAVCFYLENKPLKLLPSHVFYDPTLPVLLTKETFLFVLVIGIFVVMINSWIPVMKFKSLLRKD